MFDLLGIDWGQKWIGLALGSSLTGLILPQDICPSLHFPSVFQDLLNTKPIQKIVVGRPTNFQLQDTATTQKIDQFVDHLRTALKKNWPKIEIVTVNERSTSLEAVHKLRGIGYGAKQTSRLDSQAAAQILEIYLTYHT
jgi:putative transcription antitermination factor YqgF